MTPGRRRPLYRGRCFGRLLRDSLRLSRHRVRHGGRRSGQHRESFHHLATIHDGNPRNRVRVIGANIRRSRCQRCEDTLRDHTMAAKTT